MRILIVGLGLIGGSFAKAFKKFTDCDIIGCDKDNEVIKKALKNSAIDSEFSGDFSGIDIMILGLYPESAIKFLEENAEKIDKNTIVTDCGGVKEKVCRGVEAVVRKNGLTFIGMHPMAGIEKFGFDYSIADMFSGASLILTPYSDTPKEKVDFLGNTMKVLGFSKIQLSTPSEHDKIIAYTSQLAHIVSSAYVKSPTSMQHKGFSAGSFKDMTRVAHLNEAMWTELFMDNPDNLAWEIDAIVERLKEFSVALKCADREKLFELLREGRIKKDIVDSF